MALPPPSAPTARSLYLDENRGMNATVATRSLYLYDSRGISPALSSRSLYLDENRVPPSARSQAIVVG